MHTYTASILTRNGKYINNGRMEIFPYVIVAMSAALLVVISGRSHSNKSDRIFTTRGKIYHPSLCLFFFCSRKMALIYPPYTCFPLVVF